MATKQKKIKLTEETYSQASLAALIGVKPTDIKKARDEGKVMEPTRVSTKRYAFNREQAASVARHFGFVVN